MARAYGVDVAVYQPTDLAAYHKAGASFAIVKLTEGTGYFNPRAMSQVASSRANHLYTHAYHFANFGSSTTQAKEEADYFLSWARKASISKKRMLWLDWEASSANRVDGGETANTAAILTFMTKIKAAGYRPGLYSGAALMRSVIDTKQVIAKFGTCLWVASYPTMAAVSTADFNYFPSMDGVAIWQFTSTWKGLGVDGNVAVAEINATTTTSPAPKPKATSNDFNHVVKVKDLGAGKASWKVRLLSKDGHYTDSYVPQGSSWKTAKVMTIKGKKCYLIGKDLWIPDEFVTITK